MSKATLETISDLVVVELYDMTNKRIWFKNLSLENYDYDFNDLYRRGREMASEYLGILDKNHKPTNNKYRLELKFLVEDKANAK